MSGGEKGSTSGRISDRLSLSAGHVFVRGTALTQAAVGKRLGEFVQHPGMDELVIREVVEFTDKLAQVRLDSPVLAFTAAGEVLG